MTLRYLRFWSESVSYDEGDNDGDNPDASEGQNQGVNGAVILIWQFHGDTSFTALGN